MHMIFYSTDGAENAVFGSHDSADVRIKSLGNFSREPRLAVFRAEDYVQQNLGIRPGHSDSFAPPGQGRG